MSQNKSLADNLSFDNDADWDFGATEQDNTSVSAVVPKVKAGTTIDEVDDDDENEEAANLDEGTGVADEREEEVADVKPPVKKAAPKKVASTKKEDEESEEEDEDEEEEDDESTLNFEDLDEDEDAPAKDKKEKPKDKTETTAKAEVTPEDDEEFFTTLATELKEKGVFEHVELEKGKKYTEEEFFELQAEELDARVEEELAAIVDKQKLGDEGLAYLKHLKRGGNAKNFIQVYAGTGIDLEGFDENDEKQRDRILMYQQTVVEGKDAEEAETYIQFLKDGGKDKAQAVKVAAKLKAKEEADREAFEEAETKRANQRAEGNKKFNEQLIDTISKTEAVGLVPINKVDQKELPSYMTKPKVKVGQKTYIPEFQNDLAKILRAETKEDREKLVLLGKLVKGGFDLKDITPKVETKVVKDVRSRLKQARTGNVKTNGSVSYGKRTLAEMFDND